MMHSRPVPHGQKKDDDVSRNKVASSNDRVINTHRRRRHVVTRYEPYKRPDPTKVPPDLFVDRPRMLHDPNLGDEWVDRARQLLREPSLTRAGDDQIWRHPSQHPYDDPSPAFIWRSPFARHTPEYHCPPPLAAAAAAEPEEEQPPPSKSRNEAAPLNSRHNEPYTHKSFCLQALLSAAPGRWMLLSEVLEYVTNRYPRLESLRPRNHNRWSGFNFALKALNACGLVEKYTLRGIGGQNRWRVAEGARQQAISAAWKPKLPTARGQQQHRKDPTPGRSAARPRRRTL